MNTSQKTREALWADAMRAERRGDAPAYERMLRDLASVLRAMIARRGASAGLGPQEVEDVIQEILIGVHTMRRRWDDTKPFTPWLYAIIRYKLTDAVRRRVREHRRFTDISVEDWEKIVAEPDRAVGLSNGLVDMEVDRALNHLSAGQRKIVEAVAIEGHSIREMASDMKTSEGAIRVTLHRALKKLSALAGDGEAAGKREAA